MLKGDIGHAAGAVYEYLSKHGEVSMSQLQRGVKGSHGTFVPHAIGWLAREDKIEMNRVGKTIRIRLKGH